MILIVNSSHKHYYLQVYIIAENFHVVQYLWISALQHFTGSNFIQAHKHTSVYVQIIACLFCRLIFANNHENWTPWNFPLYNMAGGLFAQNIHGLWYMQRPFEPVSTSGHDGVCCNCLKLFHMYSCSNKWRKAVLKIRNQVIFGQGRRDRLTLSGYLTNIVATYVMKYINCNLIFTAETHSKTNRSIIQYNVQHS